tara:strand:+ start:574 stop:852 length:279 start_codon:yes stop_codon:yes gene_type:complete
VFEFEMNTASYILFGFAAFWFFGGLAFFAFLRWYALKQFVRNTKQKTINTGIALYIGWQEFKRTGIWGCAMMAPMLIPIIVTILCLYFDGGR